MMDGMNIALSDEALSDAGDFFSQIQQRIERTWWAEYDQRFWHTIAHGDKCCCVLPAVVAVEGNQP